MPIKDKVDAAFNRYFKENLGPRTFIVFKEKHGDRYFDTSTREKLEKMALYILDQRVEEGWLGEEEDFQPVNQKQIEEEILNEVGLTEDEVYNRLKKGTEVFTLAVEKINAIKGRSTHELRYLNTLQMAKKAIKNKDGVLAFNVLVRDRNNEYSDFEFEKFEKPEC